ncbi:rhomboid family intramembrane serine protease [Penaeicola halotolerans]|uniref:rhomboid family intramembrane serine protease n=1 Tax=Penaeicola halotolerans TaxID=2793196 RepID=UPI0021D3765C|nr:rhomboid family intramembrane serine protease [Penaeicola halotolerans]
MNVDISLTIVLIAITVLISYFGFKNETFRSKAVMNGYKVVHDRSYWRMILSGFVHKDEMHLFFNMFTLYFFGGVLENSFVYWFGFAGYFWFTLFYLTALIVSDLPTLLKHRHDPYYNSLGASGGVSAMVFASIIIMPFSDICIFGLICLPGILLGVMFLAYSYYKSKNGNDMINHDAHIFGALYGVLFMFIIKPDSLFSFIEELKAWIA